MRHNVPKFCMSGEQHKTSKSIIMSSCTDSAKKIRGCRKFNLGMVEDLCNVMLNVYVIYVLVDYHTFALKCVHVL